MDRETIDQFTRSLPVPRHRRGAIERELRSHIDESRRDLVLSGWRPEDAEREASERLGDAGEIAEAFAEAYRPPRRHQIGVAVALATFMLAGVYGVGGTLASARAVHHHRVVTHQAAHHIAAHRTPAARR